MPKATNDQIKAVCNVLHSRGREVTWRDVRNWLEKLRTIALNRGEKPPNEHGICEGVLSGEYSTTAALHLYFGDSLEKQDAAYGDEGIGLCED